MLLGELGVDARSADLAKVLPGVAMSIEPLEGGEELGHFLGKFEGAMGMGEHPCAHRRRRGGELQQLAEPVHLSPDAQERPSLVHGRNNHSRR